MEAYWIILADFLCSDDDDDDGSDGGSDDTAAAAAADDDDDDDDDDVPGGPCVHRLILGSPAALRHESPSLWVGVSGLVCRHTESAAQRHPTQTQRPYQESSPCQGLLFLLFKLRYFIIFNMLDGNVTCKLLKCK